MKLYLVQQDQNMDYDSYDSFVVAAESAEDAIEMLPDGGTFASEDSRYSTGTWASSSEHVSATLVGEALGNLKAGEVICSSFNAG